VVVVHILCPGQCVAGKQEDESVAQKSKTSVNREDERDRLVFSHVVMGKELSFRSGGSWEL
jgi:hypothetical protein